MTTRFSIIAWLVLVPAIGVAQQPPAQPAPAQQPPAQAQPPQQTPPAKPAVEAGKPPASPAYTYDPAGRRDPFISLVGRGTDPQSQVVRPAGMAGLLISEVTVKGVLRDRTGFLVMLRAPDNKTYTVRIGAKLLDGTVKSISQDKVIFSQDVNDPLSLVKQREVPKPVRQGDGR
jgi:type IV pilus assembly protein PilP